MFVVRVLSGELCCMLAIRSAYVAFVVCVGNVQSVCAFGRSRVWLRCSLVHVFGFAVGVMRLLCLRTTTSFVLQTLL